MIKMSGGPINRGVTHYLKVPVVEIPPGDFTVTLTPTVVQSASSPKRIRTNIPLIWLEGNLSILVPLAVHLAPPVSTEAVMVEPEGMALLYREVLFGS